MLGKKCREASREPFSTSVVVVAGQGYFILLLAVVFLFTRPVFVNVCFPPRCLLSSLLTGHQGAQMSGLAWSGKVIFVIPWVYTSPASLL